METLMCIKVKTVGKHGSKVIQLEAIIKIAIRLVCKIHLFVYFNLPSLIILQLYFVVQ